MMMSGSWFCLLTRWLVDSITTRHFENGFVMSSPIKGLAIWKVGRDAPECVFDLIRLREVRPQFVTKSGRGTIELPPGGWATQPEWMNRWDRFVPAMYPCRRLELLDDVEAVAETIRLHARKRFQ